MKFLSVALLVVGVMCLTETAKAKSTQTRALLDVLNSSKAQTGNASSGGSSNPSPQNQALELLKALKDAIQSLSGQLTGSLSGLPLTDDSTGSSAKGSSSDSPAPLGLSTTPSPSGSSSGAGNGSPSQTASQTPSPTAVSTTSGSQTETRALSSILGGGNGAVLSRVLLNIIKTLLNQTGIDSGTSDMNIELNDFITIVESLLNNFNIL